MERGNARLKFFDRYVGPFLLLMLLPMRFFRSRSVPSQIRSVGLLKTAAIGDTVLVSAMIDDLKAFDPTMRIVLFVGGSNAGFAKRLSGVDSVVQLPLTRPLKALGLIRQEAFDLFIDFDTWPRISAIFSALARAGLRLGFKTQGQYRHYMYDQAVTHQNDQHELENYRKLMSGLAVAGRSLPQTLGHPWLGGERKVVFHLWPSGTQSHLKEWAPGHWQKLALSLLKLDDFSFVLSGGPEDQQRSLDFMNQLPSDVRSRFSSTAGCSFDATLRLLQRCSLLVSVNTGVMHIGAAMGVPTLGLHGPTNPRRWGPLGARVRSVASRWPGAGQLNLGFEYQDDRNFMDGIDDAEVFTACQELLSSSVAQANSKS